MNALPNIFTSRKMPDEDFDAAARALILAADAAGLEAHLGGGNAGQAKAVLTAAPPADKMPLLFLTVMHDQAECTRLLLAAKADANVADATGSTACYLAARNDAASCLELLVGAGADVGRARRSGATPLYVATQNDSRRCLRLLVEAGADLNAPKEGGFTPLCIGTLRNRKECVELLVQAGADVNRAYEVADRFTPLMLATHCNHLEIVGVLCQAEALLGLKDAQGRTALAIATAEGNEVAASALAARSEQLERESELVAQEATLQELRHLAPCQSDLEVEATQLEQLQAQSAAFASEEGVFGTASELQSACMLIAQSLLPAQRLVGDLGDLDNKGAEMESHLARTKAELDSLQARLATDPADAQCVAARDAARAKYLETLVTLKKCYEERQRRGNKYASESDRVGAVAGKALEAATASGAAGGEAPEMAAAITGALPLLKRCMGELADANRATLGAMATLSSCMARELQLMEGLKAPLAASCATCHAAIAANATTLVGDTPRADLEMLGVLLAQLRKHEAEASKAQASLAAVRSNLKSIESLKARELEISDEVFDISQQLAAAERQGGAAAAEAAPLRARRGAAEGRAAEVRAQQLEVQRRLHEPRLLEWYPEMRKLMGLRARAELGVAPPSGGPVDAKCGLALLELGAELERAPGWRALLARPKQGGAELTLAQLSLPRSAAFERAHEVLAPLRSPLLLLPSRVFYEADAPALTQVLTPGLAGLESLAPWVASVRGDVAALGSAEGLAQLRARLAPLLCAVALMHRHGVMHGAITPAAVRCRPDGSVALTDVGFPHGGVVGPYGAPEAVHDAAAHGRAPLAADAWPVGAMLLELLTGSTPRWNQAVGRLEDAHTSEPLLPPSAPGPLAEAWRLATALTTKAPASRMAVSHALLSPLFAPLLPTDAVSALQTSDVFGGGEEAAAAAAAAAVATDAPDWLNSAAAILPAAGGGAAPPPSALGLGSAQLVEVSLVGGGDAAALLEATLRAAPQLQPTSLLRGVDTASGVQQPASQLLSAAFAAAAGAGAGLLEATAADLPLMPRAGPLDGAAAGRFEALGRLLGYAVARSLHVPLPLPASLLGYLVGDAALATQELGRALTLLGAHDPPRAQQLRRVLAKRHGPSGEARGETLGALLPGVPLDEIGVGGVVLSDTNKAKMVLTVVEQLLYGCRRAALEALKRGFEGVLGEAALGALGPDELGSRLLGWEQPQPELVMGRGEGECCLYFHTSDWDDEALRETYRDWFAAWAESLGRSKRCALLLLVFGGATGKVLRRATSVLMGGSGECSFLPEAQLVYLPAASSAAEFNQRMEAAVML